MIVVILPRGGYIERIAIKEWRIVDKHPPNRSAALLFYNTGKMQSVAERNCDAWDDYFGVFELGAAIAGNDYRHLDSGFAQSRRKRTDHIAKAAGFRKRHRFGGRH